MSFIVFKIKGDKSLFFQFWQVQVSGLRSPVTPLESELYLDKTIESSRAGIAHSPFK